MLYAPLTSLMCSTCSAHLILLALITLAHTRTKENQQLKAILVFLKSHVGSTENVGGHKHYELFITCIQLASIIFWVMIIFDVATPLTAPTAICHLTTVAREDGS
jgi:hypothetical protein